VVDISVGLADIELPARSERLCDTLDYVAVARTARRVVAERHYPLVESLATAIAQAVLARPGATWARVRIRKLGCLRHAAAAGVEVTIDLDQSALRPEPVSPDDVAGPEQTIVVGGGAAGLAAALWCWRLGHPALLLDPGEELGGQLHLVHAPMPDLPAMEGLTGLALARRMWRQFVWHQGRWSRSRLRALRTDPTQCLLELEGLTPSGERWSRTIVSQTVVLALGVRRRELGVPGEHELFGRGILQTGSRDTDRLIGKRVVVVGGGDSACENAVILAGAGARVTLVHRGRVLSARQQLARAVVAQPAVELRLASQVARFLGDRQLEAVELAGGERLPADAALVRIGWLPNTEALPAGWLDEEGYLKVDGHGQVPGQSRVFGCGDVLGRLSPAVATAFGSAALAVRAAVQKLEEPR
jgi:thioredoxin reductase (NADPH)